MFLDPNFNRWVILFCFCLLICCVFCFSLNTHAWPDLTKSLGFVSTRKSRVSYIHVRWRVSKQTTNPNWSPINEFDFIWIETILYLFMYYYWQQTVPRRLSRVPLMFNVVKNTNQMFSRNTMCPDEQYGVTGSKFISDVVSDVTAICLRTGVWGR